MGDSTKKVLLGGAAVLIFAAAVVLYVVRRPGGADLPTKYNYWGVCLETKEDISGEAPAGTTEPYANPKTGRPTVYSWWYCNNCQWRFVPELAKDSNGIPRAPMAPRCPHCGGVSCGKWFPADPEQAEPKGKAPLPKIPT